MEKPDSICRRNTLVLRLLLLLPLLLLLHAECENFASRGSSHEPTYAGRAALPGGFPESGQ